MKVRLFASLREMAGSSIVDVDASTVGELLERLSTQLGPGFDRVMATGSVVLNGDRIPAAGATAGRAADADRPIGDDDEVALLPPVSGGA